ncbi:unnamed protein product [Paramecium primaurelia]|uniref:Uncharacterized protein n=1 Tax=Paramecium primaurelia TaxID=5886 RepID=A0A8S1M857_PARPR|nr:unnamed protein product [Paramecium primaurelia]
MSQNKIILLGDCGVGKTTILHKFLDINSQPETTIGVQHHSFSRNNIKFSIWDTAGQEKYRSVVSSHYKRAKAALLIYDCSSEETLLHIDKWIEELIFQVGTKIIMILIGNKTDLQKVDFNESVQNLQDKYEINYHILTNYKDVEFKDKMNQVFDQISISNILQYIYVWDCLFKINNIHQINKYLHQNKMQFHLNLQHSLIIMHQVIQKLFKMEKRNLRMFLEVMKMIDNLVSVDYILLNKLIFINHYDIIHQIKRYQENKSSSIVFLFYIEIINLQFLSQ